MPYNQQHEIFDARAATISELFNTNSGKVGFKIPVYQRKYDWSHNNIHRIFEDVISGLHGLNDRKDSLTFLGSIILVDDKQAKKQEPNFHGNSLTIIDGQQRLTTLSLIAGCLCEEISNQLQHFNTSSKIIDKEVIKWINDEANNATDRLRQLIYGEFTRDGSASFHIPRIVRHNDYRSDNERGTEYKSEIATHLASFIPERKILSESNLSYYSNQYDDKFQSNLGFIKDRVVELATMEADDDNSSFVLLPKIQDFIKSPYRKLFKRQPQGSAAASRAISLACEKFAHQTRPLLRLIAFTIYMLDSVIIAQVNSQDERYAFDIFDSLNTTGEPLTAIQTFKPLVVQFEEDHKGYEGSQSELNFQRIDSYLESFRKTNALQNESRDIIISFALYINADKTSRQLNAQRRYLISKYTSLNESNSLTSRRGFIKNLADITEYKKEFWTKIGTGESVPDILEKDIMLICLRLLHEMKMSLTIPILCRYYIHAKESKNWDSFAKAVKAVTAFIVLRRAATGGTANIDSDLRGLMQKGHSSNQFPSTPLCIGLKTANPIVSVGDLQIYLKSWLEKSKIRTDDRIQWIDRVSAQPLYTSSAPLCKFILLAALNNARSKPSEPTYLTKERASSETSYLSYKMWTSSECQTVEHIAPQSTKDTEWDISIYKNSYLINTLGNLTLLPALKNSIVGNANWERKKMFYTAFSAPTHESLEKIKALAESQGTPFSKKDFELIKAGVQLPMIKYICAHPKWDAQIIEDRSKNLATLVWQEIRPWLGD